MRTLPTSIDEVIQQLDEIISDTISDNNYLGIFAYVYRRTTAEIKKGIEEKQFEDNERMEHMDVRFANKYITAYWNYKTGRGPVFRAWQIPFESRLSRLTIMQHLLLGMNAHINLDLGISAAETAQGVNIEGLKNDFMKVNDILFSLTREMQVKVDRISWWMFLVDRVSKNEDEAVINFSMKKARQAAWLFACRLAATKENEKEAVTVETDLLISSLAEIVKRPPSRLLRVLLQFISRFEEKDVKRIVSALSA